MNCKPGDLAIIVKSEAGNEGRVVRCLKLAKVKGWRTDKIWLIDQKIYNTSGICEPYANDSSLRPIRDPGEDARDETLTWLPVPSRESTPA